MFVGVNVRVRSAAQAVLSREKCEEDSPTIGAVAANNSTTITPHNNHNRQTNGFVRDDMIVYSRRRRRLCWLRRSAVTHLLFPESASAFVSCPDSLSVCVDHPRTDGSQTLHSPRAMASTAAQPSREELLAIGKRKLLQFQQSKGKANAYNSTTQPAASSTSLSTSAAPSPFTLRLPTVQVNGVSDPATTRPQPTSFSSSISQPSSDSVSFPSASSVQPSPSSQLPAPFPTPTPRRALLPFLDGAGTSEPGTPPSSDFHASNASFLQPGHADSELSSSSSSRSATPTIPLTTVSAAPSSFQPLAPVPSSTASADVGLVPSSYSAYDAQADYNPYAEPPPAVLARSGVVTPQPTTDSQPPPPSSSHAIDASYTHLGNVAPSAQAVSLSSAVDSGSTAPSFQSYFSTSQPSSSPSTSTADHPTPATSTASSLILDTQLPAPSSSSSDTAPTLPKSSSTPSTASAAETEQSYDATTANVQYYQDDAGNIFYYAADGQPVYYNQATGEYSTTPPSMNGASSSVASSSVATAPAAASSDDVSTLQQKVAEYERYIATLQSSLLSGTASPLPALSSLSAELDLSRTDNERLQGQLRQLQSRLEGQSKAMSELLEDNSSLVHEYEDVCERLQSAELMEERRQGWVKQRDEDTELAAREDGLRDAGGMLGDHSDLLHQLSDDSARVQRELVEGMQLTATIRSQWQLILRLIQQAHEHSVAQSTLSMSDASTALVHINGVDGSKADWSSILQQTEALSSFLSQKEDHDHQLSMQLGHMRQLLDPVALVLSPSRSNAAASTLPLLMPAHSSTPSSNIASSTSAVVPSADTAVVPFDSSSSSSNTSTAALSSLQSENSMLHDQLAAQQERAATLIKDKVMLAKRIEAAFEEKAVLTESLREALDALGREKDMYRQAVQEAHETARRTASTTVHAPSPASSASTQRDYDRYGDDSSSMHAAYQRLHTPLRQSGTRASASSAQARRALASRRKADETSGLLGSLWSMVFGSSVATVIAEEDEEENDEEDDRDLEADRVIVV